MEHGLRQLAVIIFGEHQLPADNFALFGHKPMWMDDAEGSRVPTRTVRDRNRFNLASPKLLLEQTVKIEGDCAAHVASAPLNQFPDGLKGGPFARRSLAVRVNLGAKFFEKGHLTVADLSGAVFA